MAQNDIYSLAKLFGAKNITDNSFAKTASGINYVNQDGQVDQARELLNSAQTPLGAIGAGINYYIQSKNKKKAIDQLSAELKADNEGKAAQKATIIASLFPEEKRGVADTLDLETLQKFAAKKLEPQDPNAAIDADLDRQYKKAQINKMYRDSSESGSPKPPRLPVQAVKAQNEGLETIGALSGINADLSGVEKQIDSGQLKLGPVNNLVSKAKNFVGMSDETSRNFASFKSTLEKQRNDSLRLNKGVQTEGDAVRAWNELFQNINDPQLVKQRLGEIQKINSRGADLQKLNVDQIRANYGAEPLDYSNYQNRPAAIGGGQAQGGGFKILSIRNQ